MQDDNIFWFMQNSGCTKEVISQVCRVTVGFSDFFSEIIVSEDSP